nr:MAG TPA: hypothetical protein [Caudoviricetes sp.]
MLFISFLAEKNCNFYIFNNKFIYRLVYKLYICTIKI